MHIDLFKIGPFTVHSYGLMIAIGVIAAFVLAMKRAPKRGLDPDFLFNMGFIGLIGGILGAKLMYILVELPAILEDPSVLLDVGNGFVVYGGIIGGIFAPWIYCKVKKVNFMPYLDLAIPSIPLAQGFGRIGCFLAGCCYGRETDAWYGVVFPESSMAHPAGVPLIPTQLISSVGDFVIAGVLLYAARKRRSGGLILSLYMIMYSIGRFLVEFLRQDPRGEVASLSTSQFISIFILAGGILMAVISVKRFPVKEDTAQEEAREA